jgi:hypothetical protein
MGCGMIHIKSLWIADNTGITNFRLWLQADLQPPEIDVCFAPNNGHSRRSW